MSTNDLQALFANLRPRPRDSSTPSYNPSHPTDYSSPFSGPSPLAATPPPLRSQANESSHQNQSQMAQAAAPATSANAQSLLNLLNFGSATPAPPNPSSQPLSSAEDNIKASKEDDTGQRSSLSLAQQNPALPSGSLTTSLSPLVASQSSVSPQVNLPSQGQNGDSSSANTRDASQDALLKLLSAARPKSSTSTHQTLARRTPSQSRDSTSPIPPFSTASTLQISNNGSARPENTSSAQSQPLFTYTNPFEALQASLGNSKSSTPKPVPVAHRPESIHEPHPSIEANDEHTGDAAEHVATPEQMGKRKILTPKLPSFPKGNTMSREGSADPAFAMDAIAREGTAQAAENQPLKYAETKQAPESQFAAGRQAHRSADPPKQDDSSGLDKSGEQHADAGDEWEDVDGSPTKTDSRIVPVYNFPIKPFVSIGLQLPEPSEITVREGGVMEISRLKKEFDQLDRSLAAATSKYITYAMIRHGGMRVIRQDDGSDRQVFKSTGDRIFNVTFCTTSITGEPSDDQAVLGTGISGAVYYATINKDSNDLFEKDELDSASLIFPPYPPADENTAGGVLKTRAKRSSRHPEFFAIGRGKAIHLVWPASAFSPRYGIDGSNQRVDVEKFFQERSLQIATGKAGKDFTFSEDDSLIVSLDKTGRLRFWDIRELIDTSNAKAARVAGMTVDTPLLTLSTASPSEKSWPTSVTFVDKVRPYTKGSALRYVLVGLRQNHTLQLWDIALGKAVQEISFPHANETDGICSVCYHANSGIIVVGHPTRNSLFFIHLSAPRYTLPMNLSQAEYVQKIASGDPDLPKPESTACMSGIREIAFSGRGQLRSVELLPIYRTSEAQKALDEHTTLFELYVVHSRGVTCLHINKQDLGWNASSKVVQGINAADEGFVSLKDLKLGSVIEEGPRETSPAEDATQAKTSKKKSAKKASTSVEPVEIGQTDDYEANKPTSSNTAPKTGLEAASSISVPDTPAVKETKKAKKKVVQATEPSVNGKAGSSTELPVKSSATSKAVDTNTADAPADMTTSVPVIPASSGKASTKADALNIGISGDWLDKELKKVEKGVSAEFHKELNALQKSIQNDRAVQDSAAVARQEALLRLVSATLSNNVERSLSSILSTEVTQTLVPAITTATVQSVTHQVGEAVSESLQAIVPREVRSQLPAAVNAALQTPSMVRSISDGVTSKIAAQTEAQLNALLEQRIVPAFKTLAVSTAEQAAAEVEYRLRDEIRHLEQDRRRDMDRLEKLGEVLQATAATLQQMSDSQVAFQGQILRDRRQIVLLDETSGSGSRQASTTVATQSPRALTGPVPPRQLTKEELELEQISQLMNDGRYEEASIKWLQSAQFSDLFDKLFIHFTPEYLSTDVGSLIAFSIAVTIGNSLNTNIAQRLEWISAAFHAVDLEVSYPFHLSAYHSNVFMQDPEIADLAQHAPGLLTSLIQKLERLYMTVAERNPSDPALRIMPVVSRRAKEMRATMSGETPAYQ
jgi:hypothetical protein